MKELAMIFPGMVFILSLIFIGACWAFDLSGFWWAVGGAGAALSFGSIIVINGIGDTHW